MKLYLIQHGISLPEKKDPEKSLAQREKKKLKGQ
jgi:phosphohistidine phosphatase SixA